MDIQHDNTGHTYEGPAGDRTQPVAWNVHSTFPISDTNSTDNMSVPSNPCCFSKATVAPYNETHSPAVKHLGGRGETFELSSQAF